MKRDYRLFLQDIVDAIRSIDAFIQGMDFEDFINDDKTSSAVVRKLEIIGEATKNIPADIRNQHKHIPWSEMARMRDKMIHFYFGLDHEIVWKVIKHRLPDILIQIEKMLSTKA